MSLGDLLFFFLKATNGIIAFWIFPELYVCICVHICIHTHMHMYASILLMYHIFMYMTLTVLYLAFCIHWLQFFSSCIDICFLGVVVWRWLSTPMCENTIVYLLLSFVKSGFFTTAAILSNIALKKYVHIISKRKKGRKAAFILEKRSGI